MATPPVRLNKYLAHTLGISRRQADIWIEEGRVSVNGAVANLGKVVQPERDEIKANNQKVQVGPKANYTFLLLNKPIGYVCSRRQQDDTPTVYTLIPRKYQHLKVAGRLDKDSCGLIVLTDDGDAIFNLTHPKFGKIKIYHIALNKPLKQTDQQEIEKGIQLDDGTSRLKIATLKLNNPKTHHQIPNTYQITMSEGRNRQIRRTFKALGYSVTYLQRIALGSFQLNNLKEGEHKITTSLHIKT